MTWNTKTEYHGTLKDLVKLMLDNFYPDVKILTNAHSWLIKNIEAEKFAVPIRHTSNIIFDSEFAPTPKVNFFAHPDLKFLVIASDNEANSSFYSLVANDWNESISDKTILQLLQNGAIKIGIFRNTVTTDESRKLSKELNIRGGMNDHPKRISIRGLKLYHLTDAAGKSDYSHHAFDSLEQEIITRCYRLLSPLNVFPFPHEGTKFNINFTNPPESLDKKEFGESSQGKMALAGAILEHLSTNKADSLFDDWLARSKSPFTKEFAIKKWNLWRETHISITPRVATSDLPQTIIPINVPIRYPSTTKESDQIPIFEVIESASGKYHLSGFGVAVGGHDRMRKFKIRVLKRDRSILAESEPTTANALGIAARGQKDYDNNKFHITNFYPTSAPCRRARWILNAA